jgi:diguanylate cyclase (GGDEF)-like protein/hemerythrin-like metal-binding protein/PAS domain S-box-containing protein
MNMGKTPRIFFQSYSQEWLLFAVASFVLGVMFAYMVYFKHESIMDREKDQLVRAAAVAEVMIGDQLGKIRITLDNIRASLGPGWEHSDYGKLFVKDRLRILASAMTSVRTVSVFDAHGTVIASNQEHFIGQSFAYRDYFRVPAANPQSDTLYVSPPFESTSGDWLIAVSKVVVGADGEFAGIVLISLDPQDFRLTLNALRDTPQTWAALAHGEGTVFVWEPDGRESKGMNLDWPGTLFSQHLQSGNTASFFMDIVNANAERSMVALHTVQPEKLRMNSALVIAIGYSLDALYEAWRGYVAYHIVVYVLMIVFGGAVLYMTQRARRAASRETEKAEEQLRDLSAQLNSFFEITPNFLGIVTLDGACRRLNPSWERELGYGAADFDSTPLFEYFHPDDRGLVASVIEELRSGGKARSFVARFRHKNGQYRHLEWSLAARYDLLFLAALDVTERVAENVHLQMMAYHDRLTGLPNRVLFFDRLKQVLATARRGQKKAAVMFIDLDGFKYINDTHGHDAGDKVLQAVAKRLAGLVRQADTVARLGGDEFVMLLHEVGSQDDATLVARKVLAAVAEDIPLDLGNTARVGASIGISLWPDNGTCVDDVLVAADMAMYQSKKKGKNCFTMASAGCPGHDGVCFGDEYHVGVNVIDSQHLELAAIVSSLSKALRDGEEIAVVTGFFNELRTSTAHHFATEHELMVHYAYPERRAHDEKHRILLRELREMEPELSKEGALFMTDRLRTWLLEHILEQDLSLGEFLKSVGAAASASFAESTSEKS